MKWVVSMTLLALTPLGPDDRPATSWNIPLFVGGEFATRMVLPVESRLRPTPLHATRVDDGSRGRTSPGWARGR